MKTKIFKIIAILFIIALIIIWITITFNKRKNNNEINNENEKKNYNALYFNTITEFEQKPNIKNDNNIGDNENVKDKKLIDEIEETDPWGENIPITEENLKLIQVNDLYSYFLLKQCMKLFYSSKENAYEILPKELKKYDLLIDWGYKDSCEFCIDKIYKVSVNLGKDIYFIYYRQQNESSATNNKTLAVKVDKKNLSFAIYPYEYLKMNNYSNLKDNDIISLEIINIEDVDRNNNNHYRVDDISTSESSCIKELFERFKFDVNYDLKHLYNLLDEEYKNVRFGNDFQNFSTYMNSNKELYLSDIAYGYQKYDLNWYTQYIIICQNDHRFVYNMIDLMNYSIQLDYYTTAIPAYIELYNSNFPHIRAKYCIDRVKQAINEGNYEFIYAKLNPVQKSNYYNNYNDFVNFIKVYFYKLNIFEYGSYSKISDDVYEYSVTVKNEMDEKASRKFKMTIKLKEEADFSISITF